MNRQIKSLPSLYPMKQKNRISCMDTAHTESMQHTRTWKKTYTSNDRQLQSSHKKIACQNRNVNKTNSSYVNYTVIVNIYANHLIVNIYANHVIVNIYAHKIYVSSNYLWIIRSTIIHICLAQLKVLKIIYLNKCIYFYSYLTWNTKHGYKFQITYKVSITQNVHAIPKGDVWRISI